MKISGVAPQFGKGEQDRPPALTDCNCIDQLVLSQKDVAMRMSISVGSLFMGTKELLN